MIWGLLGFVMGFFAIYVISYASKRMRMAPNWLIRMSGGIPWASPKHMSSVAGGHAGYGDTIFVSRHDLAECGLTCPLCRNVAAERGDFSKVMRAIVDGQENEVLQCPAKRIVEEGREVNCGTWLIASPDTEHGDHLGDEGEVVADGSADRPEFFRFKRITAAQALREQWGMDIVSEDAVPLSAVDAPSGEVVPLGERLKSKRHEVLAGEELREKMFADFAVEEESLKAAAAAAAAAAPAPPAKPVDPRHDTTVRVAAIPDPERPT